MKGTILREEKLYIFKWHSVLLEHDKEPLHGRGKNWLRTDVERLMRLLVIQHYLHEELFINKDEMAMAYMRVGPRANDLLSGKAKVSN